MAYKPKKVEAKVDADWTISKCEIDRLIREHKGTLDDVLVTRAMALHMLTYNTDNRKLRANHVNGFASTLKNGTWENTGEAVVFAREGILNNGQHRLEGIVRSGVPAVMDIRFGIARSAFSKTDSGAKRGAGDVLSISGSTSPFSAAAAVKLLLAYEEGLPGAYLNWIDNDAILSGYRRWPDIEVAVNLNHRMMPRKGFLNASSNAFTFLAIKQTDEEAVGEFLGYVESGLTTSRNDAPRMLRERLINDFSKMGRGDRATTIERFALFIKAWNFWRAGVRPKSLRYRSDEAFPMMDVKL